MSVVYISIGSNLGDRQKNIDAALDKLKTKKGTEVVGISSVIETDPIDGPAQEKFLNACCKIDTTLYPDELLDALKSIERELGRDKNAPSKRVSAEEQLRRLQEGSFDIDETPQLRDNEPEKDKPKKKYGPRTIDLDILFYDDIIMKGNNLVIPHPLLHKRLFVLEPLAQIAPELIHPALKRSIKELLLDIKGEYETNQNP